MKIKAEVTLNKNPQKNKAYGRKAQQNERTDLPQKKKKACVLLERNSQNFPRQHPMQQIGWSREQK